MFSIPLFLKFHNDQHSLPCCHNNLKGSFNILLYIFFLNFFPKSLSNKTYTKWNIIMNI